MKTLVLTLTFCAVVLYQTTDAVIYTRWGRKVCPKGSTLLYAGYAAGSHYNAQGSGANFVCLHAEPDWEGFVAGNQAEAGSIYGVEFEIYAYPDKFPFSFANNNGVSIHNYDAVCAVCYNSKVRDQIMVPGKTKCPSSDMRLEYKGYLSSVRPTTGYYRSEYICVDSAPDVQGKVGEADNKDGGLWSPVESVCGSLPCPPYENGKEVTCCVCTI